MKLYFASAAMIACLSAAPPAQAAVTVIGKGQTVDCFRAAAKASRDALPMVDRSDALASCNAALADKILAKDRIATLINRGLIETSAGETDKAIADYDAALALDANMTEAYIGRGLALLRTERYEAARADFDHALAVGTDNAQIVYFDRGVAQEKVGNLTAAYHDYKQALAIAPDFKPASDELSRFHIVDKRVAANR
jgi:tetratricopeptide (TPR) repeat protein